MVTIKQKKELFQVFDNESCEDLIHYTSCKIYQDEIWLFLQKNKSILASHTIPQEDLKTEEDLGLYMAEIFQQVEYGDENTEIPDVIFDAYIKLGTKVFSEGARKEKIKRFENDFWFSRLRDLLKQEASQSRKHYMKIAAFWYILIDFEGYSEEEVTNVLAQDGFKMKEIIEKWKVDNLANFIERVHYIASTKQIEHFIKIIKNSNASDETKQQLIDDVLSSNILDTW